ncbi:MAG: hypothetical protein HKO79_02140 [Desulfobacterales bacterium]|nr:hypothetical protein [Deltaproteobacteria bacterium]NNL41270.1 hypothetical protein [Desulfobacterales bacterium]
MPISKQKTSKRVRQWTLLLISNRGKSITIKWFKTLLITTASILVLSLSASAWFGFLYKNSKESNQNLLNDLKNLQHKIVSLEHEKDILMARLIVTESRVEESIVKTDDSILADQAEVKKSKIEKKSAKPEIPISVSADDLIVYHQPDLNTLRVQYMLRNKGSKAQAISGRSVVILKNKENDNQKKWLILPRVPLVSGKPSGKRGRNFSIFNLKTMKFRANDQTGPGQYNIATVYIFSRTGDLLLEKDFPIGVKFKTVTSPKKKKSASLPAKKKIKTATPPKKIKPEAESVQKKKPIVAPPSEKKKPDTSIQVDHQSTSPADEIVVQSIPPKANDTTTTGQADPDEQKSTLEKTDESPAIIRE